MELIVEDFGYDKLIDFIKSPNSYLDILGMSEAQLREKWINFIRRAYLPVTA